MFMFLFLFFSKLLLCSFFIISSEKWFNYVVTFFCFENAKNLRRSDDAKRRKKRGWPSNNECKVLSVLGQTEQVVGKLNCGILNSSGETTFRFIKFIKDVGNCRERTA